jgi:hypothetical protein
MVPLAHLGFKNETQFAVGNRYFECNVGLDLSCASLGPQLISTHISLKGVMVAATAAAAPLTLDRVIGQTCLSNAALAVNSVTGDVVSAFYHAFETAIICST